MAAAAAASTGFDPRRVACVAPTESKSDLRELDEALTREVLAQGHNRTSLLLACADSSVSLPELARDACGVVKSDPGRAGTLAHLLNSVVGFPRFFDTTNTAHHGFESAYAGLFRDCCAAVLDCHRAAVPI